MRFDAPLVTGRLIRRYRRFLADVRLDGGESVTAHCANTGSMLGCQPAGARVWLAASRDPRRRLAWTWELVEAAPGVLVGVNTGRANRVVEEALRAGRVPELRGYADLRREQRYGQENSRVDFLLDDAGRGRCYVEVKSVTLGDGQGGGWFPDARTVRGARHLRELVLERQRGHRSVLLFCVQRGDVHRVRPAAQIDPEYAAMLAAAMAAGVEVYALRCRVTPREIALDLALPVELDDLPDASDEPG